MERTERLKHKWRIQESSKAAELAAKLKLKSAGFGNWKDSTGEITHKTVDDKLEPIKKSDTSSNSDGDSTESSGLAGKFQSFPESESDTTLAGRVKEGLGVKDFKDIKFLDEDSMDYEEFERLGDLVTELGQLEGEVDDSDGFVATYDVEGVKVVLTNDMGYSTINAKSGDLEKLEKVLN